MKFYKQSKHGITKQISQATSDNRFIISGVYGKGLDLDKRNIVGTNLVVVGGTGILPFIDLFAYLARRLISKNCKQGQVFEGETFEDYMGDAKFIVYAYYPDRDNAIGVEFTEKVAQLFAHFGLHDRFMFVPQYTRNRDKKLATTNDVISLMQSLPAQTDLKNVFVCGPPPMNNMFQRISSRLCSEFGLQSHQIDVI